MRNDDLRVLFSYNENTGLFYWLVDRVGGNHQGFVKARVGEVAGKVDKSTGYVRIRTHGRKFFAHRLAWFFVHGQWPSLHIDHINGIKTDNRRAWLRPSAYSFKACESGRCWALPWADRREV